MKKHYLGNVKSNEASIDTYFRIYDPAIRAFRNSYGYASHAMHTTPMDSLAAGYYCKDNKYYKNPKLLELMHNVLAFMESHHRPNFTIDMMESNFFCSPLFEAVNISRAYRIMQKYASTDDEKKLLKRFTDYLPMMEKSLLNGGIHTPNHRWIGASGMLMLANIMDSTDLRNLAFAYLNEGVDMNEFGEYTERSPHYSEVCNTSFMQIALETGDRSYLEYAKKNMDLLFRYLEPNFTMFTQNSNRVDTHEGNVNAVTKPYYLYYTYLHMSYLTNNPQYAKFADDIYNAVEKIHGTGPGSLWMYLAYPELMEYEPKMEQYPTSYNIFHGDIVRYRNEDFSASILTRSPNFLFVQTGDLRCFVRICASFFAVAQFKPLSIELIGKDTYRMKMKAHGEYYGPLPEKPATTAWKEMDHSLRPVNNKVDLEYIVTVKIKPDRVSLNVKTEGCDNVPCKIEFCITPPVDVQYDSVELKGLPDECLSVNAKEIKIKKENDCLTLTNSFSEHTYHKDMRGSVPPSKGVFTVYYTSFTHIDASVDIIGTKETK